MDRKSGPKRARLGELEVNDEFLRYPVALWPHRVPIFRVARREGAIGSRWHCCRGGKGGLVVVGVRKN